MINLKLSRSYPRLSVVGVQMKVEIIVTEGEQGEAIISLIEKTGASMLVLGIHEESVIHR